MYSFILDARYLIYMFVSLFFPITIATPMITYAKYNISMSNANPEFVKHTAYTIGSSNEQAVLNILEQFLEDHTLEFMEQYKN